jgi:hypothetical protein
MATQLLTEPTHTPALSPDGSDFRNNADGRNEDEAITPIPRITGSELGLIYDSLLFQDTDLKQMSRMI